ncbi:MAG: hypothetical protein A2X49_16720 [Lentisphaerae bacterium GWF2_52_8]|nr:MAG: hypothetical protein A2X49_16720 [Lentisphaerae bacterium GWF2_52_8]
MSTKTDAASLDFELFRREDGRLVMRRDENGKLTEVPLRIACCFPWSLREEFISLRDDKGRELALVEKLSQLKPDTRQLVEEELNSAFFVPRIRELLSIERQAELFLWRVETDSGPRSFLTGHDEHPRTLPNGRILIKDVSNDLYLIENPKELSAKSWKLLWAYLD